MTTRSAPQMESVQNREQRPGRDLLDMRRVATVLRRARLVPGGRHLDAPRTHNITVVPNHGVQVICTTRGRPAHPRRHIAAAPPRRER
jgi:hypothetical protein